MVQPSSVLANSQSRNQDFSIERIVFAIEAAMFSGIQREPASVYGFLITTSLLRIPILAEHRSNQSN